MRTTLTFMAAMLLLAVLCAAQLNPASPLFWEASLSPVVMVLRYTLVIVLLWFLVYTPETPWLRVSAGLSASLLAVWVAGAAYMGVLGFIDLLVFAPAIMAVFVALLESKPADEPFRLFELAGLLLARGHRKTRLAAALAAQFCWLFAADIGLALDDYIASVAAEARPLHQ